MTTLQRRQDGLDRVFFQILRDHPDQPEVKRVEEVLSLLVAANTYREEWLRHLHSEQDTIPALLDNQQRMKESEFAYYKCLEQLTDALKRYQWRSAVSGDINGFEEKLVWEGVLERTKPETDYFHWEYHRVRRLLDCTRTPGELARFRRCSDCRNWFYAATSHQRFCGDACRRHFTASSPEFKQKRRDYMKQVYRPQQKQRDASSLALAKGTPRKAPTGTKSKKGS